MAVSTPDTQQRVVAYHQAASGPGGAVVRRFRNPAQFDVLSGRGGNVNKHFGNIYFRQIVKGRKMEYNRSKKDRKAEICREVMAHVAGKGGTFLVKENESSSSAFWTEQSDDRTMAKVSQALREGAPKIRESLGGGGSSSSATSRKRNHHVIVMSTPRPAGYDYDAKNPIAEEVTSNNNNDDDTNNNNNKRVRLDCTLGGKHYHCPVPPSQVTPPMTTTTAPASVTTAMPLLELSSSSLLSTIPPLPKSIQRSESSITLTGILPDGMEIDNVLLEDFVNPFGTTTEMMLPPPPPPPVPSQHRQHGPIQRSHSLCLSDISAHPNYLEDDFINPFDNEDHNNDGGAADRYNFQYTFTRQTSNASDMGGLGSLFRNDDTDEQQQQITVARRPSWQEPDYHGSSSFESVVAATTHHPSHFFSPTLIVP